MKKIKNNIIHFRDFLDKRNLIPQFTPDSVFIIVIALCSLFFYDQSAYEEIYTMLTNSWRMTLIVFAGIFFTLYTAFFKQFLTNAQKVYILFFALVINFVISLIAFEKLYQNGSYLLLVFPLINIVTFFFVLILWHLDLYTTSRLGTRSAGLNSMLFGTIMVSLIVFIFKHFSPESPWEVVLSAAITYSTLVNRSVVSHIPPLFKDRYRAILQLEALFDRAKVSGLDQINNNQFHNYNFLVITEREGKKELFNGVDGISTRAYYKGLIEERNIKESVMFVNLGWVESKRAWWTPTKKKQALMCYAHIQDTNKLHEFAIPLDEEADRLTISGGGIAYFASSVITQ